MDVSSELQHGISRIPGLQEDYRRYEHLDRSNTYNQAESIPFLKAR